MADINVCNITGRLGQDPEIKYFESGKVTASFSVAVNAYDFTNKKDITTWIPCKVWSKKAEFISEYAKKGDYLAIQGKFQVNKWHDDNSGQDRTFTFILVDEVKIFNKKESGGE